MKKFFSLMLILVCSLYLSACLFDAHNYVLCDENGHKWIESKVIINSVTKEETKVYKCEVCGKIYKGNMNEIINPKAYYFNIPYPFIFKESAIINNIDDVYNFLNNDNNLDYDYDWIVPTYYYFEKYTEEFFTNKSLIAFCLDESSSSIKVEVEKLYINSDEVSIELKKTSPDWCEDAMASWLIIVEVDTKLDSSLNININGKLYTNNTPSDDFTLFDYYNYDINYLDVKEIQYTEINPSLAPGTIQNATFTNDKVDIFNIIGYLRNLKLTKSNSEKDYIYGLTCPCYSIITNDNKEYKISIQMLYYYNNEVYTHNFVKPTMEKGIDALCIPDLQKSFEVYVNDKLSKYSFEGFSNLMLKEYTPNVYDLSNDLYINASSKLRVINDKVCEFNSKYYKVIGEYDFGDLIELTENERIKDEVLMALYFEGKVIMAVKYYKGQSINKLDLLNLIYFNRDERIFDKELYLDNTYTTILANYVINKDIKIYIDYKNYDYVY